jgi:uncharacterized protein (UPF0276 family)
MTAKIVEPGASEEISLPKRAGISLKPEHYDQILGERPDIGWFEVHPENYMGAGGPPHQYLTAIREIYPLSLHGVGLSIGSAGRIDLAHVDRLKTLVNRYQPAQVSEHLAWSTHDGGFLNDLLPLPYTEETLNTVVDHIDEVQRALGRTILLENPATYIVFPESSYDEIDFLKAIVERSGCSLLLDVNNVYVSCTNHNRDAEDYIERFPIEHVGEVHLAGHAEDLDDSGGRLLIDSHDRQVVDDVWRLYGRVVDRSGQISTLIEWDSDIPDLPVLLAEAALADATLAKARRQKTARHELA